MPFETTIRIGSFITILAAMGIAESFWPRRTLVSSKKQRWLSNLFIALISTLFARLVLPVVPAGFALFCAERSIGLFNMIPIQNWISIVASIILLDMVIYWQHVLFHKQHLLWRIHRMHHADIDIDASTGIRFHPLEILLSACIKLGAVALIGPPVTAVIFFEVLLNGCAVFNHSNVRMPLNIDAVIRTVIVTPDMHRVHHSTNMREANMNFGFNFPWWDKLFGTYKNQPALGHTEMSIGLNIFRESRYATVFRMLMIPFT